MHFSRLSEKEIFGNLIIFSFLRPRALDKFYRVSVLSAQHVSKELMIMTVEEGGWFRLVGWREKKIMQGKQHR